MDDASPQLGIRPAELNDAAAIDWLIVCLDRFHAHARPDLFRVPTGSPRGEDFLQIALEDENQQILVAVRGGEVVGYVHARIKTAEGDCRVQRSYSEIDTISVHPNAQRLGIGRKLMEAALTWAISRGVDDHQVAVHQFNQVARRLYEQLGFTPSVTLLRRQEERSRPGGNQTSHDA